MHKVNIPEYIIERVIKRRGRLEIFDTINPKSTALLVIDMQNCFVVPKLSIVEVPGVEAIAPNINKIAKSIRNHGGNVIWTKHRYTSDWISWYENGQIETDGYFYKGELDSTYREWYEDGMKKYVITYKSGVIHGVLKKWDENGVKVLHNTYRNGEFVDY